MWCIKGYILVFVLYLIYYMAICFNQGVCRVLLEPGWYLGPTVGGVPVGVQQQRDVVVSLRVLDLEYNLERINTMI